MNSEVGRLESTRADDDYAFVEEPPQWVPRAVAQTVEPIFEGLLEEERTSREMQEADPSFRQHSEEEFRRRRLLLKRLASDPRMQAVWSEGFTGSVEPITGGRINFSIQPIVKRSKR
jgi:hypothetical protein